MDLGSVLPILREQNGAGTKVARPEDVNGNKQGHFFSENSYDIPGGKVDTIQESSVQSGQGFHTQATKQTSVMKQEFAGSDMKPSSGKFFPLHSPLIMPVNREKTTSNVKLCSPKSSKIINIKLNNLIPFAKC